MRVAIDYDTLRAAGPSVGLAVRVASWTGRFDHQEPETRALAELCRSVLEEARHHGLVPSELQLDFDAATRQLGGYRLWVQAVRDAIAPKEPTQMVAFMLDDPWRLGILLEILHPEVESPWGIGDSCTCSMGQNGGLGIEEYLTDLGLLTGSHGQSIERALFPRRDPEHRTSVAEEGCESDLSAREELRAAFGPLGADEIKELWRESSLIGGNFLGGIESCAPTLRQKAVAELEHVEEGSPGSLPVLFRPLPLSAPEKEHVSGLERLQASHHGLTGREAIQRGRRPVGVAPLVRSALMTLRHGEISWRGTFDSIDELLRGQILRL